MDKIYTIKQESYFELNNNILNLLYLPLIGNTAVQLYNVFASEYRFLSESDFKTEKPHSEILRKLECTWDQFENTRKKLEAIGLLTTFEHSHNGKRVYKLSSTMSFKQFTQNDELMNLLTNRIGNIEFAKIKLCIQSEGQSAEYNNISKDITFLMNDDELKTHYSFNFTLLTQDLIAATGEKILLTQEVKELIEDYSINKYIEYKYILNDVKSSITSKNQISIKALEDKLNDRLNEAKEKQNIINCEINRKYEIFSKTENDNEFEQIISDYENHKTENYIMAIIKSDLDFATLNLIDDLRKKGLKDSVMNVVVDYSLFKNSGRLVPNYIMKLCQSLLINRIMETKGAIEWFKAIVNPSLKTKVTPKRIYSKPTKTVKDQKEVFFEDKEINPEAQAWVNGMFGDK